MADIVFENVTKELSPSRGLYGLSLSVDQGHSFALLGPTGGGKSLAVSLLMGFQRPDRGACRIRGLSCFADRARIHRTLGFVSANPPLPRGLSGEGYLRFMSSYLGGASMEKAHSIAEKLDVNLLGKGCSMTVADRKKLHILKALMRDPAILVLDEPTAGLDALSKNALTGLLAEERSAGKTLFITTRTLEEARQLCDTVGIIRKGSLVALQPVDALAYTRQKVYHITFENGSQAASFAQEWEEGVEVLRNRAIVAIPGTPQALLSTLSKYTVVDLVGGRQSMEEAFLKYYGDDLL